MFIDAGKVSVAFLLSPLYALTCVASITVPAAKVAPLVILTLKLPRSTCVSPVPV